MKIFVDENIPRLTVETLQRDGHDVADIRGTEREGISDEEIWEIVVNEKRLLITTDKGFAGHRDEVHYGILIVCLNKPNRKKIHNSILRSFSYFNEKEWKGSMIIARDTVQSIWRTGAVKFI